MRRAARLMWSFRPLRRCGARVKYIFHFTRFLKAINLPFASASLEKLIPLPLPHPWRGILPGFTSNAARNDSPVEVKSASEL